MAHSISIGARTSQCGRMLCCRADRAANCSEAIAALTPILTKSSNQTGHLHTYGHGTASSKAHRPIAVRQSSCASSSTRRRGTAIRAASFQVETKPQVVVTREQGKNGKLVKALAVHGIECLELPLIEHRDGPDVHLLPQVLREETWDWIFITSPEAATVFLKGWRAAGRPKVRLSVVGAGTGKVLEEAPEADALQPEFTPSKATAKVLAAEIPEPQPGSKVLYPASVKAGTDLQEGLEARGFLVTRLNTYSTETVRTVDPDALAAAATAPVATFASPTAVKAWVDRVCEGDVKRWDGAAACIGNTSAVAARKAGLDKIYFPDSPGIDGWVNSVLEALSAGKT